MAKGRMLNRTIATDSRLNRLSVNDQWLFMRLLPFADDYGRLTGDVFEFKYQIIPSSNWSENRIKDTLKRIASTGLVEWVENYTIQLNGFFKNQKIGHRKAESLYPTIKELTEKGLERFGKVGKGRNNIIEYNISKSNIKEYNLSDEFVMFWDEYPKSRKSDKVKMLSKWEDACKEITADELLTALKTQKKLLWDDPKYIPLMATWLNQKRWELDPEAEDVKELTYKGGLNGN